MIKLTAVCMDCSNEGSFTKRRGQETAVEVIGGADKYLAVCRSCFKSPHKSPQKSPRKHETSMINHIKEAKMVANRKLFKSPVKINS